MSHRARLTEIARRAMREHGLEPDFPPAAKSQAERLDPAPIDGARDLRRLPWTSLDNDDSRDLDQLAVCEPHGDRVLLRVAIADVDAVIARGSAIDDHAQQNTTSVYTPAGVFPMLPLPVSTGHTSLNPGEDRMAMVVEMLVDADGALERTDVYRAAVHNHGKLAYDSVTAWLNGTAPPPAPLAKSRTLAEQLLALDEVASRLRARRHELGALDFDRSAEEPALEGDRVTGARQLNPERGQDLIEDLMIAANTATARFLASRGVPGLRRVVRTPQRLPRIVKLARDVGERLLDEPDAKALGAFLARRKKVDPDGFPELSLGVIKLLGSGEYAVTDASGQHAGHFALAVSAYTHSTAPNRRFPDLVTQRLLKASLNGNGPAYRHEELELLAAHCTRQEDAANKVERQVRKAAAALLYSSRIGDTFDAIVTGAAPKGTWIRTRRPRIEGKVVRGFEGLDVGDRVRATLISTDPDRGFIDFAVE